jgi:hypothetical protein
LQQRAALEQDLMSRNDGGTAGQRARDIHQWIYDDDDGEHPPPFTQAS